MKIFYFISLKFIIKIFKNINLFTKINFRYRKVNFNKKKCILQT